MNFETLRAGRICFGLQFEGTISYVGLTQELAHIRADQEAKKGEGQYQ